MHGWKLREEWRGIPALIGNLVKFGETELLFPHFRLLKRVLPHKTAAMPESDTQTILIPLYIALGLLVILLALAFGIHHRLTRIEKRLSGAADRRDDSDSSPSPAETSAGGAFEMFLAEEPERQKLPKREQFANYRKWRQEKGLNWPKP